MKTNRNGLIATVLAASALVGCEQHRTELGEIIHEQGTVTTEYHAAYTTTHVGKVGKSSVVHVTHHPARYEVKVVTPGCTQEFNNEHFFNRLKDVGPVDVAYRFATDVRYKVRDGDEDVIERKPDGCRVLSVQ